MIRVGIIGAKGYAAGEALRWLLGHPEVEVTALMARVDSPEPLERYLSSTVGSEAWNSRDLKSRPH